MIKRFEDLECWQVARELVKEIYKISFKEPFFRDFALRDQIRKAAVSVLSNIAEGFETFSDLEFCRFLNFSIRSTAEVQSQCYIAIDIGYVNQEEFEKIYQLAERCRQICKGFARYLKSSGRQDAKTPARQHEQGGES